MKTEIKNLKQDHQVTKTLRSLLLLTAVAFMLMSGSVYAQNNPDAQKAKEYEQKAKTQSNLGDDLLKEANKHKELARDPKKQAHVRKSHKDHSENKEREAKDAYEKAAELYEKASNLKKAAQYYEKADKKDKATQAHEKSGNFKRAAELYAQKKSTSLPESEKNKRKAAENYEKAANKPGLNANEKRNLLRKAKEYYEKLRQLYNSWIPNCKKHEKEKLLNKKKIVEKKIAQLASEIQNIPEDSSNTRVYEEYISLEKKASEIVQQGEFYISEMNAFLKEAQSLPEGEQKYSFQMEANMMQKEANLAFVKAAELYEQAGIFDKAAYYYEKASQMEKAEAARAKAGMQARTAELNAKKGNMYQAAQKYEKEASNPGLHPKQQWQLLSNAQQVYSDLINLNRELLQNCQSADCEKIDLEIGELENKIELINDKKNQLNNQHDVRSDSKNNNNSNGNNRNERSNSGKSKSQQQLDKVNNRKNNPNPRDKRPNQQKQKVVIIAIMFGDGTIEESRKETRDWSADFMERSLLTVLRLKYPRQAFTFGSKKFLDSFSLLKNGNIVSFTIIRGSTKYIINFYSKANQFKTAILNSHYIFYTGHAGGNKNTILHGFGTQGGQFDLQSLQKHKNINSIMNGKQILLVRCYSSVAASTLASINSNSWGTKTTNGCIPIRTEILTGSISVIVKGQSMEQAVKGANKVITGSSATNKELFVHYGKKKK